MTLIGTAARFTFAHLGLVGVLALACGLIAGYYWWRDSLIAQGYDKAKGECIAQVAKVTQEAQAQQQAMQAKLDEAAQSRNAQSDARLAQIAGKLSKIPTPGGSSVPVTCKADPARVLWADSTR